MTDHIPLPIRLDPRLRPAEAPLAEAWYKDSKARAANCSSARTYDLVEGTRAVVFHVLAAQTIEDATRPTWEGRSSLHWVIPGPMDAAHGQHVWATGCEDRAVWAIDPALSHPDLWEGAQDANQFTVNAAFMAGPGGLTDWQIAIAADLVRYCWAYYPNLTQVLGLHHLSGADPATGDRFPWAALEAAILSAADA